jgi:hypothetical protein
MRDRLRITTGLAVFVALAAFPIWHALGTGGALARPELERPVGEPACVEDSATMTTRHAALLQEWRNAVVRDGQKDYTAASGQSYVMSLTGTCMHCHSDGSKFCDRCHSYAGVELNCWSCHIEPKGN